MDFGTVGQVKATMDRIDANRAARERGKEMANAVIHALQQELDGTGPAVIEVATETAVREIRSYLDSLVPNPLRQLPLVGVQVSLPVNGVQTSIPVNRQQELVTKAQVPVDGGVAADVEEAMGIADWIIDNADDVPSRGREFAESVSEKAEAILESVLERDSVTAGQLEALRNMQRGLAKWLGKR